MENVLRKIQQKILHSILKENDDTGEVDSNMINTNTDETKRGESEAIEDGTNDESNYNIHCVDQNLLREGIYSDEDDKRLNDSSENEEDEMIENDEEGEEENDDNDEGEEDNDNELFMNVMSSNAKASYNYKDTLGPRKVRRACYEEFYLGDMKLSRMILDYSKSIKRQDHYYNRLEKTYSKKHTIKASIELIKLFDEVEGRMKNVVNDKRWKRELIMKSVNNELNKMIKDNELNLIRDVPVEGQRISKEKSKQMVNLQRKHQKLIIDHEILQGENDELKRSYIELKNRYEQLIGDRPDSFNSLNSFGKTTSFTSSQKALRGLSIDRGRNSKSEINDYSINDEL
ncbi:hypothetical protein CANINC_000824 [Pichia inconspicua]|uniref:Uncharacterized protein n=1 Tax=Pichia inconspicua TaxID=52247 RepID=A0A4T0X571_9ASCO|nr:hypothetical protein CANINC_000824 [[Candida] inconspicua]